MTAYTCICPYCGLLTTVPGDTAGKLTFYWSCPACDCLFKTKAASLNDEQAIYTTVMAREGVLNKKRKI